MHVCEWESGPKGIAAFEVNITLNTIVDLRICKNINNIFGINIDLRLIV
jgi:hypothetical protein